MFNATSIQTDHKDLVHDVAYDFYGKRFATCSSDQTVKIWDLDNGNEFYCSASFKAHSSLVWKVTWAHPEFGQIIATCSFDRSVGIWEEKTDSTPTPPGSSAQATQTSSDIHYRPVSQWIRRALLVESRSSVTDVKFAPKHLGLTLATCSSDGTLRIYEAPDIMNLSQWNPQHELNCKISCSCLSWNPSPFHNAMIAVGSNESSDTTANSTKVSSSAVPMSRLQIYECENNRRWFKVEISTLITEPVLDVSFAFNIGRDYHLLAVAGSDVKIFTIKSVTTSNNEQQLPNQPYITSNSSALASSSKYDLRQIASFSDHQSRVWRLSWNLTGTILASAGEDGSIRLWKSNYLNTWKAIGQIRMDKGRRPAQAAAMGSFAVSR